MTTLLLYKQPDTGYLTCERPRMRARLLARVGAWTLDGALANGACPDSSASLSLRAHKLISQTTRRQLADELHRLIHDAVRPPHPAISAVPICWRDVLLAREQIEALADLLVSSAPVDVRGIAQLHVLLRDGSSPLYYPPRAGQLEQTLCQIADALEPAL